MAVRKWAVRPDQVFELANGEQIAVVSRQALVEALMDGEAMVHRGGGVLTLVVGRHPTDLPGEMVTTGAILEWKDRTDARQQPEHATELFTAPAAPVEQAGVPVGPFEDDAPEAPAAPDYASMVPAPDGLDELTLEEEDVSAIPEALR